MPLVMCRRDWNGVFHRTIGGTRRAFPPGEPVELRDEEIPAILMDIGKALQAVDFDDRGKLRVIELTPQQLAQFRAPPAAAALVPAAGMEQAVEGPEMVTESAAPSDALETVEVPAPSNPSRGKRK